jgi:hypothetical protein
VLVDGDKGEVKGHCLYRSKAEGARGGVIPWERIERITPGHRKLHLKDVVVNVPHHQGTM